MYGHRRILALAFVVCQHALRGADLVSEFHLRVPRRSHSFEFARRSSRYIEWLGQAEMDLIRMLSGFA
jgi:hypothetical protein